MHHVPITSSSTRVDVLRWLNASIATDTYVQEHRSGPASAPPESLGLIVAHSSVWLDAPAEDAGDRHVQRSAAIEIQVRADASWKLSVRAERANLDPGDDKPVSDVRLRPAGAPEYLPLSTAERIILRGERTKDWVTWSFDLDLVKRPGERCGPYHVQMLFAISPDLPTPSR